MGRESWHYLYNRKAWKELRLDHLAKEPLCVFCQREGKLTPATVVDHITPHKGNLDLFFDDNNLQSLCKLHQIGCDINGLPIDEEHPFNKGRGG